MRVVSVATTSGSSSSGAGRLDRDGPTDAPVAVVGPVRPLELPAEGVRFCLTGSGPALKLARVPRRTWPSILAEAEVATVTVWVTGQTRASMFLKPQG